MSISFSPGTFVLLINSVLHHAIHHRIYRHLVTLDELIAYQG